MLAMTNEPIEHHAHLGTGNGLVQFVCCARTEQPYDILWTAPGGTRPVNAFHTPRQAYDLLINHLTRGRGDDPTVTTVLESADRLILEVETPEPWRSKKQDVRPAIEHIAAQLDFVHLDVNLR